MDFKIEQIAFGAKDPQKLMHMFSLLGCKEWSHDVVVADGHVFGKAASNVADLYFNYDLGFELEILKYRSGWNWHLQKYNPLPDIFLSHIGMHVQDDEPGIEEIDKAYYEMQAIGIGVAQDVWTQGHTNPHIAGKRKYQYVVFDSHEKLGFDLKLIRRINL